MKASPFPSSGVKYMPKRLPRASAFQAHDVVLRYPESSWSGISERDGHVVVAMKTRDVHVGAEGCSCLLWAAAVDWTHLAAKRERREHCELAMLQGTAEGLFAYGVALGMDPRESVALRVIRICGEYWAKWGTVVRLRHAQPAALCQTSLRAVAASC
jgi:hypothetical protein